MLNNENRAVNAIWKTDLGSAEAKLVLYQLATKHELGDRYSSSWKDTEKFLSDFELKWCQFKDIQVGTQLSEVKLNRTFKDLEEKGFIVSKQQPAKLSKKGAVKSGDVTVYAITDKIFAEFLNTSQSDNVATA
ncbi:MAG: hypothetical protein HRU19_28285 [Pseudobacteriovorax sp.]|nr:hypothetical protein [Pseudobacteriovorax sp.]